MSKHISQREARRLRKRVNALESLIARERRTYAQEWTGGVNIMNAEEDAETAVAIRTARRLGHAVVVVGDETSNIRFMALPHFKENV